MSTDQQQTAESRTRVNEAAVSQARADLAYAQAQLANTVIRAPFSGTVVKKMAEVGESVTDRIDQYANGFRQSVVEAMPYSPLDIFRRNPSAIEANFAGGNPKVGQFYLDRPFKGCGAPRTPIKKLYISNSLWPWSATHLSTGYIAACVVAEDLGVRKQPWWNHKPLGWFRKWVKKQSGHEWSPFITVG